jgi:hypothetical protein
MSALLQLVPLRVGGAINVTDGLTAPDHFANGLPYDADSTLSVAVDGVIDHYHQGLGFTAIGRLVTTLTGPPTRFGSGAAPFNATGALVMAIGANAHYAHGVGYTPNSSVNSV